MDSIPSEDQKTRVDTNWEERLEKARAQREAVLRARGAEGGTKVKKPFAEPASSNVDMAEKISFASSSATLQPKARPAAGKRSPWKRVAQIGVGFCAGIGVGVGIMASQTQLLSRDTLAEDQAAPVALAQNTAPDAVAAAPEMLVQAVAAAEPAPEVELAAGPSVLDELTAAIVPLSAVAPPNFPEMQNGPTRGTVQLAALNVPLPEAPRLDALPSVGEPAQRIVLQTPDVGGAVAPALQDIAPALMPFSQGEAETALDDSLRVASNVSFQAEPEITAYRREVSGLPVIGPVAGLAALYVVAPEQPLLLAALTPAPIVSRPETDAGVILASLDDDLSVFTEHARLSAAPSVGVPPRVDLSLPAPAIPGAKDMEMAIFAAGTVGDDALETTQSVVESYGLPVIAVRRVGYRISQNHVRYYDPETAEAASLLASKIGGVARDFTRSDVNPAPGTLEIYLAGGSRVASRPVRTPQPSAEDRLRESVLEKLRGRLER